jgi:hypothetical protein
MTRQVIKAATLQERTPDLLRLARELLDFVIRVQDLKPDTEIVMPEIGREELNLILPIMGGLEKRCVIQTFKDCVLTLPFQFPEIEPIRPPGTGPVGLPGTDPVE